MGFIAAADPASKVASVFTTVAALHNAIHVQGFIPIRADGSPFIIQEFEGGYLLDGAPMNVWIDGVWFDGQRELLEPYWAAGTIPKPDLSVISYQTAAMPADVKENYDRFKAASTPGGFGIPTSVLAVAVVGALWFFTRR